MPPRKRTKKSHESAPVQENTVAVSVTRRNVRGRRGGLKDMPNMPLDVLMEIFGFMHPRDLLNLARTTKAFRSFLMNPSAQPLWKASMARVDNLPGCPAYMNEPQFINLLFCSHCHNCLKPNIQTVCFEFSARYCSSCKKDMFVNRFHIAPLLEAAPSIVEIFQKYLPKIYESHTHKWHRPGVDLLEIRWKSLASVAEQDALAAEYATRIEQMYEAAKEFSRWRDLQKTTRSAEIERAKVDRMEAIKDRLRQEGWGVDLNWMQNQLQPITAQFANKADALTERGWKKIRSEAVSYMEGIRKQRLDAERKLVLRSHFELFDKAVKAYRGSKHRTEKSDLSPHTIDLAAMDEFKAILDVADTADLSVLDDADEMRNKLDAAQQRWRKERKTELTAMVRQSLNVPDGVEPLTLACALFRCAICDRRDLKYPEVVAHVCARGFRAFPGIYDSTASAFWSRKGSRSPWSTSVLSFSTSAVSLLRPILQACELDLDTATIRDAQGCQARLICAGCSRGAFVSSYTVTDEGSYTRYNVYDCWTALTYNLKNSKRICVFGDSRSRDHEWKRLIDAEEKAIIAVQEHPPASLHSKIKWDDLLHGCNYCEFIARRDKMCRHLRRRHDIETTDDAVDSHCYTHYDGEPTSPDMSLLRYDDGRVEVVYDPRSNAMYTLLSAMFGISAAGGFDYDDWDSDDSSGPEM